MVDQTQRLKSATVQHGPQSNRVYIMKIHENEPEQIIAEVESLAHQHSYTKIFAKVPEPLWPVFESSGYRAEATVPKFYQGQTGVVFAGKYLSAERARENQAEQRQQVLEAAMKNRTPKPLVLPPEWELRITTEQDIPEMCELYREVFPSYPFPIDTPEYLAETMQSHVDYFGVWEEGRLVALSSAEKDISGQNVEMTDFATNPSCRGKGLASLLLVTMENHLIDQGFILGYTIARAYSFGMNITFARQGYDFDGTLTNNTGISGSIESMNVWHKLLQ